MIAAPLKTSVAYPCVDKGFQAIPISEPCRDGNSRIGAASRGSSPRLRVSLHPAQEISKNIPGTIEDMAPSETTSPYFRSDNRAVNQMRPVRLTCGFVATAEGSVLIEVGNTRVLCNATVEPTVPGWMRNSGRGWVTAEYGMLPRATLTRTAREAERGKIGGRTHEIQRLIGRSLRAAVDLKALGERSIVLDCDVLQADGGTRTAAITGAAVALALALNKLVAAGTLPASPMRQMVAATSVGVVEDTVLLDLAYEEDARAEVDMNLVMTADGGLVEIQATAERQTFSAVRLREMMHVAELGMEMLFRVQQNALGG